jgi:hypothetical protein
VAIVIKKAAAKRQPAPEPLVPRPQEQPAPVAKAAVPKAQLSKLPVAESLAQLRANPSAFRAPPPMECKCCGHLYVFPCHGQNPACMNKRFADAQAVR